MINYDINHEEVKRGNRGGAVWVGLSYCLTSVICKDIHCTITHRTNVRMNSYGWVLRRSYA